jgi:hypothetical protein
VAHLFWGLMDAKVLSSLTNKVSTCINYCNEFVKLNHLEK